MIDTPTMVMIGFAFRGIGYSIVMPLVFSQAANDRRLSAGAAIAGVATFAYGGMLLGPPFIGFLSDAFSLKTAFGLFVNFGDSLLNSLASSFPQRFGWAGNGGGAAL